MRCFFNNPFAGMNTPVMPVFRLNFLFYVYRHSTWGKICNKSTLKSIQCSSIIYVRIYNAYKAQVIFSTMEKEGKLRKTQILDKYSVEDCKRFLGCVDHYIFFSKR